MYYLIITIGQTPCSPSPCLEELVCACSRISPKPAPSQHPSHVRQHPALTAQLYPAPATGDGEETHSSTPSHCCTACIRIQSTNFGFTAQATAHRSGCCWKDKERNASAAARLLQTRTADIYCTFLPVQDALLGQRVKKKKQTKPPNQKTKNCHIFPLLDNQGPPVISGGLFWHIQQVPQPPLATQQRSTSLV